MVYVSQTSSENGPWPLSNVYPNFQVRYRSEAQTVLSSIQQFDRSDCHDLRLGSNVASV